MLANQRTATVMRTVKHCGLFKALYPSDITCHHKEGEALWKARKSLIRVIRVSQG